MPNDVCVERYGTVRLNEDSVIEEFEEKPIQAKSHVISCGIYVIRRRLLIELIEKCAEEGNYDFVRDILVRYKGVKRIVGYMMTDYWRNIASVDDYFNTNMEFLKPEVRDYFFKQYPDIYSKVDDLPPAKYNMGANVKNSLITSGCIINGVVENSVNSVLNGVPKNEWDLHELNQVLLPIIPLQKLSTERVADVDDVNALIEKFDLTKDKIESENISSTISNEMQRDAILAVIVASILMLIYIAIRFSDVRFGAAAVMALIHDVMVVFMVYSVAYLSVGGTFIACMLTVLGYSINASIIIFDRIRENLATMNPEKNGYDEIVNTSISQTISRNIYSTLTTFIMVLMLFILGVASLKEFTLTLMAGLICGMYSSIFIAGPLWLTLRKKFGNKDEETAKA